MLGEGYSRQSEWLSFIKTDICTTLLLGLLFALVFTPGNWLICVFLHGLGPVARFVFVFVFAFGLANILVFGISFGLISKLTGSSVETTSSLGPRSLWCRERRFGFKIGLVYGLTAGLIYGLTNGLIYGLVFRAGLTASLVAVVEAGLTNGLTFGIGVTLVSSTTWAATLANT
jgi:hypothetical protein